MVVNSFVFGRDWFGKFFFIFSQKKKTHKNISLIYKNKVKQKCRFESSLNAFYECVYMSVTLYEIKYEISYRTCVYVAWKKKEILWIYQSFGFFDYFFTFFFKENRYHIFKMETLPFHFRQVIWSVFYNVLRYAGLCMWYM